MYYTLIIIFVCDHRLLAGEAISAQRTIYTLLILCMSCVLSLCTPDTASMVHCYTGVPPAYHGAMDPPNDIELQCVKAGVHIFIEKPVTLVPPERFIPYMEAVEKIAEENNLIVSVGYMFRYHPAIEKMLSIIKQHGRPLVHINARYLSASTAIQNQFWWDKDKSGGPIVEQATHFCDLLRYFGGDVVSSTVRAVAVGPSDTPTSPGYLSSVPDHVCEGTIQMERRVPRMTTGHWFYSSGGVGCLTHAVTLQGEKYESAIDVWADGLRLSVEDLYFPGCKLSVRIGIILRYTLSWRTVLHEITSELEVIKGQSLCHC